MAPRLPLLSPVPEADWPVAADVTFSAKECPRLQQALQITAPSTPIMSKPTPMTDSPAQSDSLADKRHFTSPSGKLESPERVNTAIWDAIPNKMNDKGQRHSKASRSLDFANHMRSGISNENQTNVILPLQGRQQSPSRRPRAATQTHMMNAITRTTNQRSAFDNFTRLELSLFQGCDGDENKSGPSELGNASDSSVFDVTGSSFRSGWSPASNKTSRYFKYPSQLQSDSNSASIASSDQNTLSATIAASSTDCVQRPALAATKRTEAQIRKAKELAEYIKSGALEPNLEPNLPVTKEFRPSACAAAFRNDSIRSTPALRVEPAIPHGDPFLDYIRGKGGITAPEAMRNLPFVAKTATVCTELKPAVIRVSSIPYNVTRKDISTIFRGHPDMVKQPMFAVGHPAAHDGVHIMMERQSGKSMDAFVEFKTAAAAANCLVRIGPNINGMRTTRVHHRRAILQQVDTAEMMEALFPRAKCVDWDGCDPTIREAENNGFQSSGFSGFITNEETLSLSKLARDPRRSRYNQDHPERVFENMIDILCKYPWHHSDLYTIAERDRIFRCTLDMLDSLCNRHVRYGHHSRLNEQLLEELVLAAQYSPGFNDRQRAQLADVVQIHVVLPLPLTTYAHWMPFLCLTKHPYASDDYLRYIAGVLAAYHVRFIGVAGNYYHHGPFGGFEVTYGQERGSMKMSTAIQLEWDWISAAMHSMLQPV